jgi:hypothetical protein
LLRGGFVAAAALSHGWQPSQLDGSPRTVTAANRPSVSTELVGVGNSFRRFIAV